MWSTGSLPKKYGRQTGFANGWFTGFLHTQSGSKTKLSQGTKGIGDKTSTKKLPRISQGKKTKRKEAITKARPPIGMCMEISVHEGILSYNFWHIFVWNNVCVHSYDDDGACWFTDLALGPGAELDKASDSCLYFEDITFHELVKCSSQKCSEEYQPLLSNAAQGSVNNCKHCKMQLSSFCTTQVFIHIYIFSLSTAVAVWTPFLTKKQTNPNPDLIPNS